MDPPEEDSPTKSLLTSEDKENGSTSIQLEDEDDNEIYVNKDATDFPDNDSVDRELSPGSSLMKTESRKSSESYGTFSPDVNKGENTVPRNLTLAERRKTRREQREQFKLMRFGSSSSGISHFTSKCVTFVERSLKQAKVIKQNHFRIWGTSIKKIEGQLGSSVCTYFKVLVWMLKINVVCMILGLGLIVGPGGYMIWHHGQTEETIFNKDDLTCNNPNFVNGTGFHVEAVNSVLQLFTGTGWMENTAMFYGWYPTSNLTTNMQGKEKTVYYFSLAYFSVGCCYFAVSLLLMLANLSKLFKKSAAEQLEYKPYSSVVFTWDYNIADTEASQLRSVSVIQSLKEELDEDEQGDTKRSLLTQVGIFFLRVLTNLICLAAVIGTVYLYVKEVLTESTESRANSTDSCGQLINEKTLEIGLEAIQLEDLSSHLAAFWKTYSASIIVSGSNVLFPVFFELIGLLEMYQFQSTRIRVTLVRTFIMKLFTVATFLYLLYRAAGPSGGITEDWQTEKNTLFYNCWEDYIGSQLYQLIMIDFLVFCAVLLFCEAFRSFIVTRVAFLRDKIGLTKREFNISTEVLDLMYKQMIFWAGFYFAPLLPIVAVIEIIVIFYLKKLSALTNVVPPKTVVLNHQSSATINGLFLISLLVVFVFIGLVIFNFQPSQFCGPFRGYTRFTDPLSNVINHATVLKKFIIDNLTTTSVLVILIILVLLVIYYYKSLAASRNVTIELLKEQVRNEIAEKEEILHRTQKNRSKSLSKEKETDGFYSKEKRKQLKRKNTELHGFANLRKSDL